MKHVNMVCGVWAMLCIYDHYSLFFLGVTAKLSPAEENVDNLMEGLEVKVR